MNDQQTVDEAPVGVQLLIDGENLYGKTVEYLKARNIPSDIAAATEFILMRLGELVDHIEDREHLQVQAGYYYLTSVGVDALRNRRMFVVFEGQLGQLGIEIVIVEKRNDKSGNVDPRLISDAYRRLFKEKRAPSHLVLVCGDKDYEQMLEDYEREGRKVAVSFYQPVNGGASVDLLTIRGLEFINFANPVQSWFVPR
jgi:uncharacterized LabA/DUF88 family protein